MTDARTITLALHGRWCGSYGIALCPAHDNRRTPALSISDGDGGRLLVKCHAGCAGGDVLRAIGDLGLDADWRPNPAAPTQRKVDDEAARAKRIQQALGIWREAGPAENTLVEHYLSSRGITCPLPVTLRYHPACWHGKEAQRLPAMIAAVGTGQRIVAVHRTYLTPQGKKITGPDAKMMLGPTGGGAVRLSPPSRSLVVCEGIETGLSLLQGIERPVEVWAALSTSGMVGLVLPRGRGEIVIAADGDTPGTKAAQALADRAFAAGLVVRVMAPPSGWDFNDMLRGVA
jgi:hypothetical protein